MTKGNIHQELAVQEIREKSIISLHKKYSYVINMTKRIKSDQEMAIQE